MIFNCPGSQNSKQPIPESVKCPYCGEDVELWTDENEVVCTKCKKVVARQVGQCCLDWCKYARECVGEEAYGKYMKNRGKDKKEE